MKTTPPPAYIPPCRPARSRTTGFARGEAQPDFEDKLIKEVPIGSRPVTIGRSPDNDLMVDNLAVSSHHARVYAEAGRLVVEDVGNLNGTFVNDLRVERATLHDGDSIWIGKHHIKVNSIGDAAIPWDEARKSAAPNINAP